MGGRRIGAGGPRAGGWGPTGPNEWHAGGGGAWHADRNWKSGRGPDKVFADWMGGALTARDTDTESVGL